MSAHRGDGVVSIGADTSPRRSLTRAARPAVLVAAFYGAIVIALLATHDWDPRLFATVGPQWERHDPGLRKQGETPAKTAFIGLLQLPLLIAFAAGAVKVVRRERRFTIHLAHVTWIALYFGLHLPIFAFARLSVVLIPAMLVYGLLPFFPTVDRPALGAPLAGARSV